METIHIRKITIAVILGALVVLSFFLLKPILLAVVMGLILAFICAPIYNKLFQWTKSSAFSAILLCILFLAIIILPFYFLIPIVVEQSVEIYSASYQIDFITPLKTIFPSLFSSEKFSEEISSIISGFVTKSVNSFIAYLSNLILNIPEMILQLFVVLFTFYFGLKGQKQFFSYMQSLLPFSKEIEKKIVDQTKVVTISVLYGQIIIGLIQGVIAGAGFFIFKVPNALILTLITCVVGILPVIGPFLVWVPVALFLLAGGMPLAALGVTIFGILSSVVDNFLRPIIVARKANIHPVILLAGMIGGLYMFGLLGFILGPLILAYLLILLDFCRDSKIKSILIQPETR
jgi:predicted PurR-regulated permease PerM